MCSLVISIFVLFCDIFLSNEVVIFIHTRTHYVVYVKLIAAAHKSSDFKVGNVTIVKSRENESLSKSIRQLTVTLRAGSRDFPMATINLFAFSELFPPKSPQRDNGRP